MGRRNDVEDDDYEDEYEEDEEGDEEGGGGGFLLGMVLAGAAAYLIMKANESPCPVCAKPVRRNAPSCPSCGVGLNWAPQTHSPGGWK